MVREDLGNEIVDKLLAAVDTVRETVVDETTLGDEITAVDPADIDGEYHWTQQ